MSPVRALRITLQLLLFLATFVLEVRVRADVAHAPGHATGQASPTLIVQQEPAGCLKTEDVCAIKTREGQIFELVLNDSTRIVLDHSSAIIRVSKNEIRFISGSVWVKAQHSFQVKTEFGDVASVMPGEFWVSRTKERVTAKATEAALELKPRGTPEALTVDPGLQNYIGTMNLEGKAETGIPVAISFKSHVDQLARVYRGSKKEFEERVTSFHATWKSATERSASINQALYERTVASAKEQKAREAARQAKAQAEREANRAFFRSRVFDGL